MNNNVKKSWEYELGWYVIKSSEEQEKLHIRFHNVTMRTQICDRQTNTQIDRQTDKSGAVQLFSFKAISDIQFSQK